MVCAKSIINANSNSGADVEFETYRVERHHVNATPTNDTHDKVYINLPKKHHVLRKVADCCHCGALRFQYEGPTFCCRKGKVDLEYIRLEDNITKKEIGRASCRERVYVLV